jgi:hypothetical protein
MSYNSRRGSSDGGGRNAEGGSRRAEGGEKSENGSWKLDGISRLEAGSTKVDLKCGNLRRNQMEHSLSQFVKRDGTYDFPESVNFQGDVNIETKMNCQGYIDMEMISEPASPGSSVLRMFVREKPGASTYMQLCGKFPAGAVVVIAEGLK